MKTKKKAIKKEEIKKERKWLVQIEETLNKIFTEKLPSLPDGFKEAIVKYGPYLVVLGMIFTVPAIFGLIWLGFTAGMRDGWLYLVSTLFAVAVLGLEIAAISGLFKRQRIAWKLMFYISLIQALSYILRFELGGLIIGTGLSWYILFQIRNYYKN